MKMHDFRNRVKSLYNIDGYMLPEMTDEEHTAFVRDPVQYFFRCSDGKAEAIFREVERRQVKNDNKGVNVPLPRITRQYYSVECEEKKDAPGVWIVEAIDDDGSIEQTIFAGPNARERAETCSREFVYRYPIATAEDAAL